MGILELVKSYELEAAAQSGREEGREEGEIKKAIVGIRRMMEKGFSTSVESEVLEIPESFVLSIEQQLLKKEEIIHALESGDASIAEIALHLDVHPMLVLILKESMAL